MTEQPTGWGSADVAYEQDTPEEIIAPEVQKQKSIPSPVPSDTCNFCKKKIPPSKGLRPRLFCGRNCCTRWHYHNNPRVKARVKACATRSRLNQIARDPTFKARNVERFKAWRLNNRDKHNASMRILVHKTYMDCKAKHICFLCRKTPVPETTVYCEACKIKRNEQRRIKHNAV